MGIVLSVKGCEDNLCQSCNILKFVSALGGRKVTTSYLSFFLNKFHTWGKKKKKKQNYNVEYNNESVEIIIRGHFTKPRQW